MMEFAIIYESKARELETACLIDCILKRSGYKSKVYSEYSLALFFSNPKVVIVPYLYSDKECKKFNNFILRNKRAVINLQWEQVFSEHVKASSFYLPSGDAKNAMHVAWGSDTKERLLSAGGIDDSHVSIVGNLSMLFNCNSFSDSRRKKEDIAKEFSIPVQFKWNLFISSFVHPTLTDVQLKDLDDKIQGMAPFIEVSKKSKTAIMSWLERFCREHQNEIIIYRPHPNEAGDEKLNELQRTYDNFFCISKYSIRQWVSIVDMNLTWISTSIVDAYFANKPCLILRPYVIAPEYEVDIFYNASTIRTYEDFERIMHSFQTHSEEPFPIERSVIISHYSEYNDKQIQEHFLDMCKKVFRNTNDYTVDCSKTNIIREVAVRLLWWISGKIKIYKIINNRYKSFASKSYANTHSLNDMIREYEILINNAL